MTVVAQRLAMIDGIELEKSAHSSDSAFCVMEAVAYVAGEPWSDHPRCACPVLTSFMTSWNDALSDADRQRLKAYIPRLVGTRSTPEVEAARSWMACDWLVRTFAVMWLRQAGLREHADAVAALPELTSKELLGSALPTIEETRASASAAWCTARTAAWGVDGAALDAAHGEGYGPDHGAPYAATLDADLGAAHDTIRDAALDAVRSAALSAGMVGGRGAAFGAALGAVFDTALDANLDAAFDAVRDTEPGEARDAVLDALQGVFGHAARSAIPDAGYVTVLGAAYDAALDALLSVAYGPVYGAACGAASDPDGDAPRNAVRGAALGAARGSLAPTVLALQGSAFDLLDRMLAATP